MWFLKKSYLVKNKHTVRLIPTGKKSTSMGFLGLYKKKFSRPTPRRDRRARALNCWTRPRRGEWPLFPQNWHTMVNISGKVAGTVPATFPEIFTIVCQFWRNASDSPRLGSDRFCLCTLHSDSLKIWGARVRARA